MAEDSSIINIVEKVHKELKIKYSVPKTAGDLMQSDIKYLTLDNSTKTCLKFMKDHQIRHAPILEKTRDDDNKTRLEFVGVISERDVLRINEPITKTGAAEKVSDKAMKRLLSKVFTRNPVTVGPDDSSCRISEYMNGNHIDMLPVLYDDGLAGIITTSDILRFYSTFFNKLNTVLVRIKRMPEAVRNNTTGWKNIEILELFSNITAGDICVKETFTLGPDDSIYAAMTAMQDKEIRHIPVTDESGRVLGLISDRDILKKLPFQHGKDVPRTDKFRGTLFDISDRASELNIKLGEIMVSKVFTVETSAGLEEVSKLMKRKKISCLPVVNAQNVLQGICTIYDLIRHMPRLYRSIR